MWRQRYENLRQAWRERRGGWGATLVVRQGLASWLQASAPPVGAEPMRDERSSLKGSTGPVVSQVPMVAALADMIGNHWREVAA